MIIENGLCNVFRIIPTLFREFISKRSGSISCCSVNIAAILKLKEKCLVSQCIKCHIVQLHAPFSIVIAQRDILRTQMKIIVYCCPCNVHSCMIILSSMII